MMACLCDGRTPLELCHGTIAHASRSAESNRVPVGSICMPGNVSRTPLPLEFDSISCGIRFKTARIQEPIRALSHSSMPLCAACLVPCVSKGNRRRDGTCGTGPVRASGRVVPLPLRGLSPRVAVRMSPPSPSRQRQTMSLGFAHRCDVSVEEGTHDCAAQSFVHLSPCVACVFAAVNDLAAGA